MKKFLGKVNGVEYTNENEFLKAKEELIKSNPNHISISCEYYETDDENELTANDYIAGLQQINENGEYVISDDLKNKLQKCSNKDEVINDLNRLIYKNDHTIDTNVGEINKNIDEINKLKKTISELEDNQISLQRVVNSSTEKIYYYKNLLKLLITDNDKDNDTEEVPENTCCNKCHCFNDCNCSKSEDESNDIISFLKVFNIF